MTEHETTEQSPRKEDPAEFEIGEHQIPWFLWLFFILIICWASIAWMPLFGY